MIRWGLAGLVVLTLGCGVGAGPVAVSPEATWDEIVDSARGATVRMAMWDGDPMINAYMREFVAPALQAEYGIRLRVVGTYGNALVNRMLVDLEAVRRSGDIDVMWINGETSYQLRQMNALYGPFTDRLPNSRYIDWENPFIAFNFQQPVEGFECPWGNVQLALIYDSRRVTDPPRTIAGLADWIKQNPGRFTFDNAFTGMTFLKCILTDFAGGPDSLHGPFDEQKYRKASARLWEFLRELQPYLWRQGRTFPEGVAQLHQLFNNGEVDFTMSCNDGEVENKVLQGVIPETSRAYVLDSGTIRNSHYLGIPFNSPRKAAALVLINLLISPEAQYQKALPMVWGDGTVLSEALLPEAWRAKFRAIDERTRVPPRAELERRAIMEPAPEVTIRLHEDFRREIIEGGR